MASSAAATQVTACTTPYRPDVEVKGDIALYFESLLPRWLKNALFCRRRIRRVILHQLTIEKPENNSSIPSKGCFAPLTRSTSVQPLPQTEDIAPHPATHKSKTRSRGGEYLEANLQHLTLQTRHEIKQISCNAEDM